MLKKLQQRQFQNANPGSNLSRNRELHSNIVPNETFFDIALPQLNIRKFTPCGRYLVTFSKQQHSISLFSYLGLKASDSDPGDVWNKLFLLKYETNLTFGSELLCKDFCLFTTNCKYIILASAVQSSAVPTFGSTPNSLNCIDSLDDVTFWIVDIETGEISDQKTLSNEYIYLTNHAGVHLYKDTLAVTSIQHQSLYLIHISQDGKFGEKKTVGYHNNEDDETYLESCRNRIIQEFEQRPLKRSRRSNPENIYHLTAPDASYAPFVYKNQEIVDNAYSGIKQRMMSFLYKRARESDDRNELNHFSLTFDLFANLVMWRSHLLNDDEIMFKFGTVDNVMYRQNPEPVSAQTVFFVMYNRKTTLVTAIFESSSQELLELYQQSDIFRGTCFNESTFLPTTLSNNKYAQEIIHHQMYTVKKARNGGAIQAVRRVCSTLPMNPQSFIDSPFFDHNLFNYDEKAITSADRSRLCTDFPVKFYDRKNGRLKFTLDYNDQPGMPQPLGSNRGQKKAVNFVFHPTEPFVITIQYSNLQVAVVNIHCRT